MKNILLITAVILVSVLFASLLINQVNGVLARQEAQIERILSLEAQVSEAQSGLAQAQAKATELELQNNAAERKLTVLESASELTQTELKNTLTDKEAAIIELNSQLDKLNEEKENLSVQVKADAVQLNELTAAAAKTAALLAAMKVQEASFSAEIAALSAEKLSLKEEVNEKDLAILQLSSDMAAQKELHQKDVTAVQAQAGLWANTIERLRVELADAHLQLAKAKGIISQCTAIIDDAAVESEFTRQILHLELRD